MAEAVRPRVAEVEGAAECLVVTCPGWLRHGEQDLPFSCVLSVSTSRVARRQGLAQDLLARCLGESAADGALVAGLGMFEQGFYDRLGFGSGPYLRLIECNPADLTVKGKPRPPRRLSHEDWEAIHAARLRRRRSHGACSLAPPEVTLSDLGSPEDSFGLGYFDGPSGTLSHALWCHGTDEHGPYRIRWLVYQTREQFLELMAVLKSLSDQVWLVALAEPPGVQLQDLLERPLSARGITEGARWASRIRSGAYYQFRMLDVPGCLALTHLPITATLRLNVTLTDPLSARLSDDCVWRGCAGKYVVTLGESSKAVPGEDSRLPTLNATVNAFTRLWLGVQPATGLAVTDRLSGPDELLKALDTTLRLPEPQPDWDF
jgi:predicted acetyltransferase